LLCYRCGSHVQDGAEKCWNCGSQLSGNQRRGASTMEIRTRQRTGSRVFGVVFKIGDLIANRYRVNDIIGSGGAGVVYRAHDQEIDVDVAVKVVNAKLVQTADEQRLFSRQTKIARKLSHQNVIRIYDEGRDEDRPFYTMQYLEGLSLRKIIDLRREKQQTFALAEIEPIYNQLCQALDYAHKTTFHGDLKPDNVIVLPDLLKVTDFALLRGLPRKPFLAIQKSRALNFRYLAPEVRLEVTELDKQVDIYSLGVILCEMLSGIVYDDAKPEQLSSSAAGLDTNILSVIKRAVARAPKDRYLAATDLYEDMRSVIAKGQSKSAVRVPPTSGEPPHLAEMPTQRLDMSRHGSRPTADDPARRPADNEKKPATPAPEQRAQPVLDERTKDTRPPAVEVAASLDVPDAPAVFQPSEASGTFATIDDDMIESSTPSSVQESAKHALPKAAPPKPEVIAAKPAAVEEAVVSRSDEDETLAQDEAPRAPLAAAEAVDPHADGLVEISNSAIELIADPRATNLIRLEQEAHAKLIEEHERKRAMAPTITDDEPLSIGSDVSSKNPTLQPMPLPDSALPGPAFAQAVARDPTTHGRLDVPESAIPLPGKTSPEARMHASPASPHVVVRGLPSGENGHPGPADGLQLPEGERPKIPRAPTAALEVKPANGHSANGKSAKPRPMTRPRMSAIPAIPEPIVLAPPSASLPPPERLFDPTPSPDLVRPPTGSRPLMVVEQAPQNGLRPETSPSQPALARIPVPAAQPNKTLIVTIVFSVLAVLVAFLVVFKLQSDQQAAQMAQINSLHTQILQMQNVATVAKEREQAAMDEAKTAETAAAEAAKAEQQAGRNADDAKQKRALAEAEAKQREADAKRLEQEARASRDAKKKEEAEKAAQVASAAAAKRKADADLEGKREKEERQKEEREKRRREKEEQAKASAERRAEKERDAKQRAEERASKLKADREAAAETARVKRDEAAEKKALAKAEAEEKRAEDKRKVDEAARAVEEKKPVELAARVEKDKPTKDDAVTEPGQGAVAASATAGGKSCPKGMVLIDAGAFMLGAPRNDPERNFGDLTYQSVDVGAYCIDYYEFPNGRGRVPQLAVSFKAAQQACKKKNKRLCTENEWEKACKGPSGSRFPYGNQWDPSACATEDDEGNKREASKSGEFKRCRSGYNVFDMSGNAAEWTASEYGQGGYVVKGGSADRPGYDGRCAARKKKKVADADALLGFRCCSDPQ
jgi:serine/threonine protein kinase/formylglycine-generating enzyme required for sulfatase activity